MGIEVTAFVGNVMDFFATFFVLQKNTVCGREIMTSRRFLKMISVRGNYIKTKVLKETAF